MIKLYKRCIIRPNGKMIKSFDIRIVLVGAGVARGLEVAVLRVGTLHVSLINISVNLVGHSFCTLDY